MRSRQEAFERHPAEADAAEAVMTVAASKTVRLFLARVQKVCTARAITELPFAGARGQFITAAGDAWNLFTQGEANSWWTDALSQEVLVQIADIYRESFANHSTLGESGPGVAEYLANAANRLSPSVPTDAFNAARSVLSSGLMVGASHKDISKALAVTFSWEPQHDYWDHRLEQLNTQIDNLLAPWGKPGDPQRELAKRTDPKIAELVSQRGTAATKVNDSRSTWDLRATTIARTEATAALNAGALQALVVEGVKCVEWLATKPRIPLKHQRTRPTHAAADGQKRPIGIPFLVGGFPLLHPGDSSLGAPGSETINCRCAIVGTDCE